MYRGSFEEYSQLEGRIREGDQLGFYKHLKGMNVEGKITFNSQYIRDCLLYTSPSPRDGLLSRMPSSA